MYWPNMHDDIKNWVASCDACMSTSSTQRKQPLIPYETPHRPWEVIGSDVMYIGNKKFLVCIDYHSRYPAVTALESLSAVSLIDALERIFADTGLPKLIISDAGTNYTSEEFGNWCNSNGVNHANTASYHHASNGMVERAIQTLKRTWTRCESSKESPWSALLLLRNTPLELGKPSPSQLMGLTQRTLMPNVLHDLRNPEEANLEFLNEKTMKMKAQHDRHNAVRDLPLLEIQQEVWIQKEPGMNMWTRGRIIAFDTPDHQGRTYKVQVYKTAKIITRNRICLKSVNKHAGPPSPYEPPPPPILMPPALRTRSQVPTIQPTQQVAPVTTPVTPQREEEVAPVKPETSETPRPPESAPPPKRQKKIPGPAPSPKNEPRYALRSRAQAAVTPSPVRPPAAHGRIITTSKAGRTSTAPANYKTTI